MPFSTPLRSFHCQVALTKHVLFTTLQICRENATVMVVTVLYPKFPLCTFCDIQWRRNRLWASTHFFYEHGPQTSLPISFFFPCTWGWHVGGLPLNIICYSSTKILNLRVKWLAVLYTHRIFRTGPLYRGGHSHINNNERVQCISKKFLIKWLGTLGLGK